jgi:hypothetical protein
MRQTPFSTSTLGDAVRWSVAERPSTGASDALRNSPPLADGQTDEEREGTETPRLQPSSRGIAGRRAGRDTRW